MDEMAFHPLITLDQGPLHYFSVLGRALYTAQHLEMNCRAIAVYIHVRTIHTGTSILDDVATRSQLDDLWKKTLGPNVNFLKKIGINEQLGNILEKARVSRNEIAHAIAIDIDESLDSQVDHRIQEIAAHVRNIASADKILSALIHVLNKDPLPSHEFLSHYEDSVEEWVVEPTHE